MHHTLQFKIRRAKSLKSKKKTDVKKRTSSANGAMVQRNSIARSFAQPYRKADTALPQLNDTDGEASGEDFMAQPINRRSDSNIGRIVLFCLASIVLLVFAFTYIR